MLTRFQRRSGPAIPAAGAGFPAMRMPSPQLSVRGLYIASPALCIPGFARVALRGPGKRRQPRAGRDRRRWPPNRDEYAPFAGVAEILALQVAETAAEHRGAGHQHHRQSRLDNEQRLARERCAVARGATGAAQRFDRIGVRRGTRPAPRRRAARSAAPDRRRSRAPSAREACRSAGIVAPANASRSSSRDAATETRSPASAPATARTMFSTSASVTIWRRDAPIARRTGRLAAPGCCVSQQQVGDVRARDQKDQAAHRQQDAEAAAVLLLHHADSGAGRHHGDRLLRQHSLDLSEPVGGIAGVVLHPLSKQVGQPGVQARDARRQASAGR